jgi:hypothetical protein
VKILHIIPTLGVGGTERQLVKLLPRMNRARFRQTVCFYTPSETIEAPLREVGIPIIFFDKSSMSIWSFFRRLRRVVLEVRPHLLRQFLGPPGRPNLRRSPPGGQRSFHREAGIAGGALL